MSKLSHCRVSQHFYFPLVVPNVSEDCSTDFVSLNTNRRQRNPECIAQIPYSIVRWLKNAKPMN